MVDEDRDQQIGELGLIHVVWVEYRGLEELVAEFDADHFLKALQQLFLGLAVFALDQIGD